MKTSLKEQSFELGLKEAPSVNGCEVRRILCAHTSMEVAVLNVNMGKTKQMQGVLTRIERPAWNTGRSEGLRAGD